MKNSFKCFCSVCLFSVHFFTNIAIGQERAIHVTVESVRQTQLSDKLEALGTLRANESVEISVNVTEILSVFHFEDGEEVTKGDLLVEMTNTEEHGLLVEANTTVTEAKRQLDRIKALVKVGNASESLLDELQRNYEAAKARLIAVESRLKDRVILAPFSGVLGLRSLSVGALVRPGDVITTLNDNSVMKLDFDIPEIWFPVISPGQKIAAISSAYKNQNFEGEVLSIDNQIDPVTRTIIVRALIPNPKNMLKQGMLMEVELFFNSRQSLQISESSIIADADKHFVYKVLSDGDKFLAKKQQIQIGSRQPGFVEVLSGLNSEDLIVNHGAFKLRDNSQVIIKSDPLASE